MTSEADPYQHRRRLRLALRRAREAAGLSQRDAATRLDWSLSKLIRSEGGVVSMSVTDLRALLDLYGVTDPAAVEPLVEAARGSRGRPWWDPYREMVSAQFAQYLSHETAASTFRVYHPSLIPGLLQTAEATRALMTMAGTKADPEAMVRLRTERQRRVFERAAPALTRFLVDEAALHRPVGGPAVTRKQLRHLLELSERPEVSIQVVPFAAGVHPLLAGPFVLLGFPDGEDEVLFLEITGGSLVNREDRELTVHYLETFETVSRDVALPESASRDRIAELLGRFDEPAA